MLRLLLVISISAQIASSSFAEDWPQFRGPGQQGESQSQNLPVEWSLDDAAWKTPLPGNGWSSPVVSKGRVYVTCAVPNGDEEVESQGKYSRKVKTSYSLRAVCIDVATGEIVWNVEIAEVPPKTSIHPKNSHASPTALVTDNRVFVHFGTYGTAALDLEGNIVWTKKIKYKPVHGSGGSPLLFEDLLIFNCDGGKEAFVIALDAASGDERWRTLRPAFEGRTFSFSTPTLIAVNGQTQIVSAGSDFVCGYEPKTGNEIWQARYPNKWSIVPRPVWAGGLVLICTGYEGPAELLAIRPDGEGDVTDSHIEWRVDKFVPYNPSPIVKDDHIYMVSDAGIATCRELKTGKLAWKERLKGNFSASPILAEDRVYFLSEEGICTVVKANPAEFEKVAENPSNERTFASIAPLDDTLLIRTETNLYRINK